MLRSVRTVKNLALIALAISALFGGASFVFTPGHEVRYYTPKPTRWCSSDQCIYTYRFQVGNTGRFTQDDVRIEFSKQSWRPLPGSLHANSMGVSRRKLTEITRKERIEYRLDPIEPDKYTEIQFSMDVPRDSTEPTWEDLDFAVTTKNGAVRYGNPTLTRAGRLFLVPLLLW